jgi:hypothetical protein
MQTRRITRGIGIACTVGLFGILVQPEAQAGKPVRHVTIQYSTEQTPTPVPMTILPPAEHFDAISAPCCEHKCCRKRERKCKHSCGCEPVTCAPSIEYKGCPAPCSITKVVTVTHPKSCTTVEVPVQVPGNSCREKVDRDRDGDLELDYGKYEVSLRWHDGGRRLVVHYDD